MSDVTNENIIDQMQREIDALEAKVEEAMKVLRDLTVINDRNVVLYLKEAAKAEELQAKLDQWNKHEAAEEPAELYFNEVYGIGSMRDQYKIAELQEQVDRECVWTRVNNSYSCWDEYDAWSTSCGEDYAIEEEWHDKITPYCSNCGGKVIEEQKP